MLLRFRVRRNVRVCRGIFTRRTIGEAETSQVAFVERDFDGTKGEERSREIDFVVMPNLISEETLASQEVAMKKSTTLLILAALAATAAHGQEQDDKGEHNRIRHVLL